MEFFSCDPFILKKNLQIMMYVLPFFWRLFRRNDQAIPRITKMTKSAVTDEINITQSGPSADGATVAKKNDSLIELATKTMTCSMWLHQHFTTE